MMIWGTREFIDRNNKIFHHVFDEFTKSNTKNYNRWLLETNTGIQWTIMIGNYVYQVIDESQWKLTQIRWGIMEHEIAQETR